MSKSKKSKSKFVSDLTDLADADTDFKEMIMIPKIL